MAQLKPFTSLDGFTPDQTKALLVALNAVVDQLNQNTRDQPVTGIVTGAYSARYDDIARINAGGTLTLPPANASAASKRVGLIIIGAGSVKVVSAPATIANAFRQGTVNGLSSDSVIGPGFTEFISDGSGAWSSDSAVESGALAAALAIIRSTRVASTATAGASAANLALMRTLAWWGV